MDALKDNSRDINTFISDHKDEIISVWENEVREKLKGAEKSSKPALRNEIVNLLDDVGQILEKKREDDLFFIKKDHSQTIRKNIAHGKLRANTAEYTVDQVIEEYYILHRIIAEKLYKANLLDLKISFLLNSIFETTIKYSATSFSESLQEMQEKIIGTLSHDLRNPLNTAMLAIDLLPDDPDEKDLYISMIKNGLERAITLSEDMLDNISVKSGKGMTLSLAEADYVKVITEAFEEASMTYTENIQCHLPNGEIKGMFDEKAVRRLIDNLISNAIKYGDPKSPIILEMTDQGEQVELKINNQGEPISEDVKKNMFEFLKKCEKKYRNQKSWGIGLALVGMVVDGHNGSIDLESNKENGTTFTIRLSKRP